MTIALTCLFAQTMSDFKQCSKKPMKITSFSLMQVHSPLKRLLFTRNEKQSFKNSHRGWETSCGHSRFLIWSCIIVQRWRKQKFNSIFFSLRILEWTSSLPMLKLTRNNVFPSHILALRMQSTDSRENVSVISPRTAKHAPFAEWEGCDLEK